MGELAQTPQAQQASAAAQLKKLNDGHRAKGAQEGRAAERAELIKRFGQAVFDQFSLLETMKAEMRAQFEREEQKHIVGNRWRGRVEGIIVGAIMVLAIGGSLILIGARASTEGIIAGSMMDANQSNDEALRALQQERSEGYTNPGQDVTRRP